MPKYYYMNRPPSIGCQPPGFSDREAWMPTKNVPGTAFYAFGWVEYQNPLSFEQVWKYDLRPANGLDDYLDWRESEGK